QHNLGRTGRGDADGLNTDEAPAGRNPAGASSCAGSERGHGQGSDEQPRVVPRLVEGVLACTDVRTSLALLVSEVGPLVVELALATEPGEFLQSPTSVGPVVRHGVHREAQRHRPPSRFHVKHDEHGPHEHGLSGCERQDMAQARELSATYRALVDRTRGHWVAQRLLNSLTRGLHPVIAERVGSKQGGKNCRESLHQSSSLAAYLPWPIFSMRSSFLIHRNTVSRTGAASPY